MKVFIAILLFMGLSLGCARLRVEGSREPIKVDISMRLDIYQHVSKDIDDIESIVSGSKEKTPKGNHQSLMNYFIGTAFAQGELSPAIEEAALRRKDRRSDLVLWEQKGIVGENRLGLVEIRVSSRATQALEKLIRDENSDRMIIYQAVAKKNNISIEEVQKMYAKRLHEDSPIGAPIEVLNISSGKYEWKVK